MVKKHRQSKRQTCRLRYKIQKRVRQHNKKLRREKKKNPDKFRKAKPKLVVPNKYPYKEQLLREAAEMKRHNEETKLARRQELKRLRKLQREGGEETTTSDFDNQAQEATKSDLILAIEEGRALVIGTCTPTTENSTKNSHYKKFQKIVEAADVILQVLDARDPLGSRCKQVEQAVLDAGSSKRLVLVLNKADLVPRETLEKWLKFLRREYPTVAFKASTQLQNRPPKRGRLFHRGTFWKRFKTTPCLGANVLMKILENYCSNRDTAIRVGVVGLPNVGKNSIIKSLKGWKACNVESTPEVEQSMEEIQLDPKIKLLNCSGVVFASSNSADALVALKNALNIESLVDPIAPVNAILQHADKEQLMMDYNLAGFETAEEFLGLMASKLGHFKKKRGLEVAAKAFLKDWNSGKIKYFTEPPEDCDEVRISATVVNEMAKEFDLASLELVETEEFERLPVFKFSGAMQMPSSSPFEAAEEGEETSDDEEDEEEASDDEEDEEETSDDEEAMETAPDEETNDKVAVELSDNDNKKRRKKVLAAAGESKTSKADETLMGIEANQRLNKLKKLEVKKLKKKATSVKAVSSSTRTTEEISDADDDDMYDFSKDFS